jgi:hypothetical protein
MAIRKKSKKTEEGAADPSLAVPIEAVLTLFRADPSVTIAQIAQIARLQGAAELAFYDRYSAPAEWLAALLKAGDPTVEFENAVAAVEGEDAAEMLRDAMRRMIALTTSHMAYFELALIEADTYHGGTLNAFTGRLLPAANGLLQKIKETNQLRPLPDWMIARALVALLIGFVASERAMPASAQFAARLMPQRMWIDSLSDILLYGLIEDDARG